MPDLTPQEEQIVTETLRTGNWDLFTEYFFQLPFSGTWVTRDDYAEAYSFLHEAWRKLGYPDDNFTAVLDDQPVELRVVYDSYYGDDPMFLIPHGFRTLPWLREFVSPQITRALAITGAGTGKTCGVGVQGLTYCALLPGFKFLNATVSQAQANMMLAEVEKWCGNTAFRKFIKVGRGVHELWKERPYPTVTVEMDPRYPSQFVCQTLNKEGTNLLSGEHDWINFDEAQLLPNIEATQPIAVTRLRGTRSTGVPRWTKMTWITNPGMNTQLRLLQEQYQKMIEDGEEGVLVIEELESHANIYLTKRQLEEQRRSLTQRQQDRWIGGQMSAVIEDNPIPEELLWRCFSEPMDEKAKRIGKFSDDIGLYEYELPYVPGRHYVVVGDVGKSPLSGMGSMNVPAIMVIDVTDFMEKPSRLVAMSWMDGMNTYATFVNRFKKYMMMYRARGYYDATNVSSAFEDVGGFEDFPYTTPISFAGLGETLKWSVTTAVLLMQHGLLRWPYIRGLWHQCRIYRPGAKHIPDDLVACVLVFARALAQEGTLWSKFTERFQWEIEEAGGGKIEETVEENDMEDGVFLLHDRHERIFAL